MNSGQSPEQELFPLQYAAPKDDDIIRAITVMLMTVIINAGSLYVQENERERRKSEGSPRAHCTRMGQSWAAQLRTPTVPWGGGGVSRPVPHSAQPTCLPARTVCSEPFSPTSTQLHFRTAVSQKKGAVKGSWLNLLVVSAKCFNVQQIHL